MLRSVSIPILFAAMVLIQHFYLRRPSGRNFSFWRVTIVLVALAWMAFETITRTNVSIYEAFAGIFLLAVLLYVQLSEWLIASGASWLNRRRGEAWIKELDYVYLLLGAIGLVISLNRLDAISAKIPIPDLLGPVILSCAVVVRLIKTRAEVAGWNKN